ncbi:NifB/NifX family molybdenum-iron cluster-binding protein [Bariatricus sp. SGI.154]|uniref:NifB/NifX family molybdenum-iron cluster-binding protein n=1 Tax=Bariatricus sp. SGI.154 TaxID=3420549 RepID=UPI003D07B7AE
MPRTGKKKRVQKIPRNCCFISPGINKEYGIIMKVEEYECIRLIDYMSYTQEECARQMEVSRATVQMLYAEARKKLARFLVEGIRLQIEGGDYTVVKGDGMISGRDSADAGCQQEEQGMAKERNNMRIAVTYENGQVFQHFGHTEQFKVYDVEDGKVVKSEIVDTNGQGHGALAGFLFNGNVDVLICGGIGGGARNALAEAGIKLFPGAQGDADAQVESYLAGTLNYDPDTVCSHHEHHHGDCGGHEHGGCGHHCG